MDAGVGDMVWSVTFQRLVRRGLWIKVHTESKGMIGETKCQMFQNKQNLQALNVLRPFKVFKPFMQNGVP